MPPPHSSKPGPRASAPGHGKAARLIVPSAASLALHAGLLGAVFAVTITVTTPRPDDGTPLGLVTVDLGVAADVPDRSAQEPTGTPDAALPVRSPATPAAIARAVRTQASGAAEALAVRTRERLAAFDPTPGLAAAGPGGAGIADSLTRSIAPGAASASFAGLSVRAAQRIVYAVDASGAMVATLPFVIDELEESINRLEPSQQFTVVLFGNGTRVAPGPANAPGDPDRPRLRSATPDAKQAVIAWARAARPTGPSDPLDGLAPALRAQPDLVFMLARSIRRSRSGAQWGLGSPATLRALEDLNPRDARTGRRPTVIKTLQFIEADPTGLMNAIAGLHGDGANDTRVITAEELRRLAETPEGENIPAIDLAEPPPDTVGPALADAVVGLGAVERSGAALRTVYGLATPTERASTRQAALDTVTLIDSDERLAVEDSRLVAARGRALLLAAAASEGDERVRLAERTLNTLGPERDALDTPSLARELTRVGAHRLLDQDDRARRLLSTILASPLRPGLLRGLAGEIELERARQLLPGPGDVIDPPRDRPFYDDVSRTTDAGWTLLFAEAVAAAALDADAGARTVIAPLERVLNRRDVLRTDRERRGLAYPRIAAAVTRLTDVRGEGVLDDLPTEVLLAAGLVASETDDAARAEALLLLAAARAPEDQRDAELPGNALLAAARVARDRGDTAEAARRLARLAREHPAHPDAPEAIAAAIEDASDTDRPELIAFALERFGAHPLADPWRLVLAAEWRDARALAVLDGVASTGGLAREADAMALAIIDDLLGSQTDRRMSAATVDLLERSADAAAALGRADSAARRLVFAEALVSSDPARAEADLAALLVLDDDTPIDVPGGRARVELGRARALVALVRTEDAGAVLRPLVARLDRAARRDPAARTDVYWGAQTLWLELVESNDGADAALAAHVARLRLTDPALGGEPWAGRLRALAERVGERVSVGPRGRALDTP